MAVAQNQSAIRQDASGRDTSWPQRPDASCFDKPQATWPYPESALSSSNTPGCGMRGKIDSFEKIGSVIGKALDKLEDGIGVIPIFIYHQ